MTAQPREAGPTDADRETARAVVRRTYGGSTLTDRIAAALAAAREAGRGDMERLERDWRADERRKVVGAFETLATLLEREKDDYGYAIRNDLKPGPWDRIRAVIAAQVDGRSEEAGR